MTDLINWKNVIHLSQKIPVIKTKQIDYECATSYTAACIEKELTSVESESREGHWEGYTDIISFSKDNPLPIKPFSNSARWMTFFILSIWFQENPRVPITQTDIFRMMKDEFLELSHRYKVQLKDENPKNTRENNTDTKVSHNLKKFSAGALIQRISMNGYKGYTYAFRKRVLQNGFNWFFENNKFFSLPQHKGFGFMSQNTDWKKLISQDLKFVKEIENGLSPWNG